MSTMAAKRAALMTLVGDTLDAALTDGTTFRRSERFRLAEKGQGAKADRDAVMGNPIRYVRVAFLGEEEPLEAETLAREVYEEVRHVFAVYAWLEYVDSPTYAASSQSTWDVLLESASGLLPVLRETAVLLSGAVGIDRPEQLIVPDEPLYLGDDDHAHYCQFFITLTG